MFTGIIEESGRVAAFTPNTTGARLRIDCAIVRQDLHTGDSISVNGVCLTAVDLAPGSFSADLAPETLQRSNLGSLTAGALVHLERSMPANGRYSGHLVQGHVDGTGELVALDLLGDENWWLTLRVPPELDRYIVHKGSICIDGISLTVASLQNDLLAVTIIPHTYSVTAMREWRPGRRLNLEVDVIAKYVEKMIGART
ncbi:MAG: riboflavin synthase [Bryobacteraceae bacterium]|nr:riboflavin synthase [Bryobacteraceae bacterium]